MKDRWLLAGSAEMLILKLISEKDRYGYQITEELKNRSENLFVMKAGTLYPILHALEEKSLIESYEKTHCGRIRKYYSITAAGKKSLEEKQAYFDQFSAAVHKVMRRVSHA